MGGLDRAAEDFFELGERAAKRGIRVGFEALAWGKHIHDYRDAWEVVRRANHPAIGTILDTFHILAKNIEVNSISSIPKEKIFLVQVADAPSLEMGVVPWSRHYRNFPGQGRLPLEGFMQALADTRYDGFFSLEIFNDQFRATPAVNTALDGIRSLVYLSELMPEHKPSQQHKSTTHGVGFVEFAVDPQLSSDLSELFSQMGFQQIGQHRSKNVTLWRHGQAQLILNAENSGFANDYFQKHGSGVCAMALEVDDIQKSLDCAKKLKHQVYSQAVRPGEHEIPAILGIDGSLIYLLERSRTNLDFWEVDFSLEPQVPSDATGLQIDHIGQVLPSSESLSWLLFYRSIFALSVSNLTEIPDPSGLINSQVVENNDKSLRLVLNASQYSGTLAAKFLTEHAGGGVQHVAFATDDIFSTLAQWQKNGVELLLISENYYTDLMARFDFDPVLLEQMQRFGVLYDRTTEGEFFHAYTKTFADLLFFELCQRVHYQGYGAVNAAIRIAAQTRETNDLNGES
jgi:4-hydroxyphenylpyruvate dioxygenase